MERLWITILMCVVWVWIVSPGQDRGGFSVFMFYHFQNISKKIFFDIILANL